MPIHFLKNIYSFIFYLALLGPNQGLSSGLLLWEHGVVATGPPGSSNFHIFMTTPIKHLFSEVIESSFYEKVGSQW